MSIPVLMGSPLFAGLDEGRVSRVAAVASRCVVPGGTELFAIGAEATEMYVVASGRVSLSVPVRILGADMDIVLEECEPPRPVAWSAMVPPHRFTLAGRCPVETELVVLKRADLLALMDEDPTIGRYLMANLAEVVGRRLHQFQVVWARGIQRNLQEKYG